MPISDATARAADAAPSDLPVLIAGPTASGKSALALEIAARQGGVIVNADASQVYACWRVITARPSVEEEAQAPHALYGHVAASEAYSTGHWLREVKALLETGIRPIIVGGTGLYFSALTKGLADIPTTPADIRDLGDRLESDEMLGSLDAATVARIDTANRARVQRAWEVQQTTGRGLAEWQDNTPAPLIQPKHCHRIVFDVEKSWLNQRIAQRFGIMMAQGALAEVEAQRSVYDPALPAHRAIGVPELMAHLEGRSTLEEATERAIIATRQFAKRQRTWMRSKMADWHKISLP
ncbi:tRNA delta(2)-isopentenylpyrophosphate transferase [Sulfitobacter noctilucicola]|uniref:tRNA dimethylallyltransferase n=1 Tax=Sulfitobacter noctilucicola TaxID=1342301 RepID=A0A7W6Q3J3_9RHOB|nr:tRNA (adenosine(37)-N6)-dimethylallyltransferase MiaA [Sulfitobacter noctilucicola]KIN65203.1 tRNA delta(2)-isopentenylpyrophosphate transferase [Sulfitobacter noctilucicola]MBB4173663.1 tRNA dimethylallyltransferase [Sulfitobacter noctilucicola]